MRIGFDAKRIFHNNTGLGNYSRTLVTNMVNTYPDVDYHLFTPSISNHDYALDFLDRNRYTIHTSGSYPGPLWRSWWSTNAISKADLDIYHGLSQELPLRRVKGQTKTVVTMHDLIADLFPDQFSMWDGRSYRYKYRKSCKIADHIIAISQSTADDIQRIYGEQAAKITTIYQSCAREFWQSKTPKSEAGDYFLYVGSVIPRKGLINILLAYELIPEHDRLPLKIVGGGGDYLYQAKEFVAENTLSGLVTFMGNVNNSDLTDLYRKARALVLPSIYEGFGIPVIESLSQGTPVITSDRSSLPEAGGPGALLVDPGNPTVIAQAMQALASNPSHAMELGLAGQSYVKETFDGQNLSHQLMELYRTIIK